MNKKPFLSLLFVIVNCVLLTGCASSQSLPKNDTIPAWKTVGQSPVFAQNHTGFALYDVARKEIVAEYQSNRYFTPASNVKIYTFLAGLAALGDSLPGLRYAVRNDSLIFWGTGDPTLLHPDFPTSKVFDFLKNWRGKLYLYPHNYAGKRFGSGWSWADYADYYQAELSSFPIYGNIVRFTNKTVSPKLFKDSLQTASWSAQFEIGRDESRNAFFSKGWPEKAFVEDIPFKTSATLTAQLLADTLHKNVGILAKLPQNIKPKTLHSMPVDTVYRRMLQESDNMLAEQVLLMCAAQTDSSRVGGFDTRKGIEFMKKKQLTDLPDELVWVDGSGLSRYNVFTPRNTVKVLQKIYEKIPAQRAFGLMAIGGRAGTIRSQYKAATPFVFAKTGTLSNNYSLSGYLLTKSGKTMIFSFMNSNYTRPTSEIRREVERVLTDVYERY